MDSAFWVDRHSWFITRRDRARYLLTDVIRNEWGWSGYILSDAGAASFVFAPRAVQFHPHVGQSDFVWLSARTMHPHEAYVW